MDKTYHFSAPGRTEIGGNHTDHQHGCVLAAAVDMTTTAEVTLNGTNTICVNSEGYKPVEINLSDLAVKESERIPQRHSFAAWRRHSPSVVISWRALTRR